MIQILIDIEKWDDFFYIINNVLKEFDHKKLKGNHFIRLTIKLFLIQISCVRFVKGFEYQIGLRRGCKNKKERLSTKRPQSLQKSRIILQALGLKAPKRPSKCWKLTSSGLSLVTRSLKACWAAFLLWRYSLLNFSFSIFVKVS